MSARQDAEALLKHLMTFFGVQGLAFNQDNECIFTIDSKIIILFYLDEKNNVLLLNAIVDTIDQNNPHIQTILYELLAGNYNWAYTAGGTLGIDSNTGIVTLCYKYTLPYSPQGFIDSLSHIASSVEYWMNRIADIESGKK